MRLISNPQTTFCFQHTSTSGKAQWDKIAQILDANPEISAMVWSDLTAQKDGKPKKNTGAKGMSADQVLRFAIVKMREELSYRKLHDRVDDSITLRKFCGLPFAPVPAFTTLQENIKKLRPQTLACVNEAIVRYAQERKVENGARIRIDTTAVETNIHHPVDSEHLWDCVRVMTRILRRVETEIPRLRGHFSDHTRAAKKLRYKLHNARGETNRKRLYRRLIQLTRHVVAYARQAVDELHPQRAVAGEDPLLALDLACALEDVVPLAEAVIAQSERRVLKGQAVPAEQKVVSIFEPHTDIIKKGQREIVYGHKILFAGGKSNLILDCLIQRGNPADAEQFVPALERHRDRFKQAPKHVATDGGFASKSNAAQARALGVENIAFSALKGNKLSELVKNERTYKRLRKWRAGIEGIISATKRAFGLDRCTWSGFQSFQAYVLLAVLAFNLQTLARHLLS
jgi:IS5 family transposase